MTYIPTEPPYTEEFLRDEHKEFIKGWDLAMDEVDTYFNNRDTYELNESYSPTLTKIMDELAEASREQIKDYLKMGRQEYIVSLIDSYTDEELKERGYKG